MGFFSLPKSSEPVASAMFDAISNVKLKIAKGSSVYAIVTWVLDQNIALSYGDITKCFEF